MLSTVTDAWQTLVPPAGDRHGPLAPLLLTLTVVTGLVDAFSYLVLGHVFVANMTGNVVFLAFALTGAKGFSIGASLAALAAFVVGALGSGRLVARLGPRRGRMLAVVDDASKPGWWRWPLVVGRERGPRRDRRCHGTCSSGSWAWPWGCRTARPASWPCPT